MHARTRRLLTGATLMLLAVACVATFGASKAGAGSEKVKIHKISACGYTASAAGTYELTKNITDSGVGTCIGINADNVTLDLNGHTITGTGSDTCVYVEYGNTSHVNDTVVGGAKKTMATLKDCKDGLYVYYSVGTHASNLKIDSPTSYGVYEEDSAGTVLTNISVALHGNSADGFYLEDGARNTITGCTVDNNSSSTSFLFDYEIGDMITHDVAEDTYSKSGNDATGFYDEYSARDTFSHDTSKGHEYGFYLYEDGYGPVTATYDSATDLNSSEEGFYVYYADQEADYGSRYHTLISHDTTNGFEYGFEDDADTSYSDSETWTKNTADNYSEYGFYIYYPTDYTMTGNVADGNTKTKKYDGSSTTYGFYLYEPESYYPFANFSKNQSYDNEYGFYSDEDAVGGTGNVAKRNKYNTYQVEITG